MSLGCAAEVRTMSWLEKMQLKHLTATQKPEICADSSFPRRTVKVSGVERVKHMLSPERVLACNSEEDAVDTDAEGLWCKVWPGCDGVRLEITKASGATIATWTSMPTTAVDNFTSVHGWWIFILCVIFMSMMYGICKVNVFHNHIVECNCRRKTTRGHFCLTTNTWE